MNANLAAVLYLVAGVLFILSLRGLSSPASSRQGNMFGMIGMAIAVGTTLASHPPADGVAWLLVILAVAIGGVLSGVVGAALAVPLALLATAAVSVVRHHAIQGEVTVGPQPSPEPDEAVSAAR